MCQLPQGCGVWGSLAPFFSTSLNKKKITYLTGEASLIKKEYCRCGPHPLQVISSRAGPYLLRERATLATPSRISGVDLHCTAGTPKTLHRRLFLVPHCTLRLSHLSVGGNTRGLEMAWPTRHVGAELRGLLGPTAHGLLGRRHPGPRLSHMVG